MRNRLDSKPYLNEISSQPTRLWFRAKPYGWGWYPSAWQGWGVLIMYVFAVIEKAIHFTLHPRTAFGVWTDLIPQIYILTVFLIIICYATGEKPGWRWGGKRDDRLDVLDKSGTLTGETATREEVHDKGLWHRAAHVYILNSKGEVLLQRRAAHNKFRPGRWYLTAGGHLRAGEASVETAMRELREELGLQTEESEFSLAGTVEKEHVLLYGNYINNEIDDIYVVKKDVEIAKLRKHVEVADIRWIPLATFKGAIAGEDPNFVSYEGLPVLFSYLARHAG